MNETPENGSVKPSYEAAGETSDLAQRMEEAAAQEAESASFTVVREKVKKRPLKWRRWLKRGLLLVGSAIVFGLIAAFVIGRFLPVFQVQDKPDSIQIAHDPTPVPEATPTPTPRLTPKPTPIPTPVPTQMPEEATPEEESEARIEERRLYYADLREISSQPMQSLVTVTGISSSEDWFNIPYEERRESIGFIFAETGTGYLVFTDYDSVEDSAAIYATMADGTITECSLVKKDMSTGLGVVNVPKESLSEETAGRIGIADLGNSYIMRQGDPVIAAGAPAGENGAVAFGQITAMNGLLSVVDAEYPLIITDILGTANGSGALINMDGQIIGLISQKHSRSGGTIVTALPISQLKPLIELLSNDDPIAYLGITGENVTAAAAENFDLPIGIYVTDVQEYSPAFEAGIRRGDIITSVGERDSLTMTILGTLLNNGMADTEQEFTVSRLGADGYVDIPLTVQIGSM